MESQVKNNFEVLYNTLLIEYYDFKESFNSLTREHVKIENNCKYKEEEM